MIECDQINIMIWNAISTVELMIDFYCVYIFLHFTSTNAKFVWIGSKRSVKWRKKITFQPSKWALKFYYIGFYETLLANRPNLYAKRETFRIVVEM